MSVRSILFSLNGRISRRTFLIYAGLTGILFTLLWFTPLLMIKMQLESIAFKSTVSLFSSVLLIWCIQVILGTWVQVAMCAKRLHDCNKPGWISCVPAFLLTATVGFFTADVLVEAKMANEFLKEGFITAVFLYSFVSAGLLVYLISTKGTEGPNEYGADPFTSQSN